jgi:hypothetical protein
MRFHSRVDIADQFVERRHVEITPSLAHQFDGAPTPKLLRAY